MAVIDLGEDTDDVADKSDAELTSMLEGVDTSALDRETEAVYGAYLDQWAAAIRSRMVQRGSVAKSHQPDTPNDDDDPEAVAELIADILGGLFGDDALHLLGTVHKDWNPSLHPRDGRGRFAPKGSAEDVAAAKAGIDDIRKLGPAARTPETVQKLAAHLAQLAVKQLNEIKKTYGLKASGNREQLVAKLLDRLPGAQERIDQERQAAAQKLSLPSTATLQDIVEKVALDAGYPEHFLTKQELTEKLDALGVSTPVQRGEAMQAAFQALKNGIPSRQNSGKNPLSPLDNTSPKGDNIVSGSNEPPQPKQEEPKMTQDQVQNWIDQRDKEWGMNDPIAGVLFKLTEIVHENQRVGGKNIIQDLNTWGVPREIGGKMAATTEELKQLNDLGYEALSRIPKTEGKQLGRGLLGEAENGGPKKIALWAPAVKRWAAENLGDVQIDRYNGTFSLRDLIAQAEKGV